MAAIVRAYLSSIALAAVIAAQPSVPYPVTPSDRDLLDQIERRTVRYFTEQSDPTTGMVLDRTRTDGKREPRNPNMASIAATGFGLTAQCIGAVRGWIPRKDAVARVRATLHFFADRAYHNHGWFYHFMDATSGERSPRSEVSSIDTALLLGGVLTVRRCFAEDADIVRTATSIYERVDFQWMLAGDPQLLSHGWKPEEGFLTHRWNAYCELMILYLLAIGSPTHPIPAESWYAWRRPALTYGGYTYVTDHSLFEHQYSHAWIDFRGRRDSGPSPVNWFDNSIAATRAHRAYCIDLGRDFPRSYSARIWGITASDSAKGYIGWGGPPREPAIDGTLAPHAAGGSLMFTPDICLPALAGMKTQLRGRVWGRYGFVDAYNPTTGWIDDDVLGIDLGITLLSAENLRDSTVWKWFMRNPEVQRAMRLAGFH